MAWYLNGERIYVEQDTGWKVERRSSEIDILDSNKTIIHDAGRKSYKRDITFVVFSGYSSRILPIINNASGISLTSDQGAQGDIYIHNFEAERLQDISRNTPVYRVTMEITKDDS
jgi:hypothetical protein